MEAKVDKEDKQSPLSVMGQRGVPGKCVPAGPYLTRGDGCGGEREGRASSIRSYFNGRG